MLEITYLLTPFLAIIIASPLSFLSFFPMNKHTGKPINLMNLTREDLVSTDGAGRDDWVTNGLKGKQISQLGVVPPPVLVIHCISIDIDNSLSYPWISIEIAAVILQLLVTTESHSSSVSTRHGTNATHTVTHMHTLRATF